MLIANQTITETPPPANTRRYLVLAALCSLLAVLVFWRIVPAEAQANENSDYQYFYEPVAQNLAAGKGLVTNDGTLALHYPPGYPLLLAATFKLAAWFSLTPATAQSGLTLLSHLLAAMFVFLLAASLWRTPTALLATLVWISYPPILWLTKQPNSEIPFMALFYGGVYTLWRGCRQQRWQLCVLAGALCGWASLIRPIGLGAGVLLALGLLITLHQPSWRLRVGLLVALLAGNVAALLPWQTWVYAKTGRAVLLSNNLVPSIRDGLRFAVNLKRYRQAVPVPEDTRALMQRIDARYHEMTSLAQIATVIRQEAGPQPLAFAKLIGLKAVRSWYATDSGRREGLLLAVQALYLSLALWGVWRSWQYGGATRAMAVGISLTLLYFWGMTILTLSILRYLTPVIGLLFVLLPGVFGKKRFLRAQAHDQADTLPGVMHIVDTLDAGGAERMAVNLVNHLPPDRYRVFLCTTRRDGTLNDSVRPEVIRLRLQRRGRFDWRALNQLAEFVRQHNIRLLHAHNTSLFIALAASWLTPDVKVIWHHHTGRFAQEDRPAHLYRWLMPWVSQVFTVNQDLAEWTVRRLCVPAERVRYLPNFASVTNAEAPNEKELPALPGATGSRVVCVANLHEDKDHLTLLRALVVVIQQHPETHLLLAGEARHPDYRVQLQAEIERLQLAAHVTLLGQRQDIAALLRASDIGVLSSVSEGLPVALLEYGAAGLPAVATDVGQCAEVLDQGRAGIIVPPAAPEKLAAALNSLLASAELRRTLGAAFQTRVRTVYSPEVVLQELCRTYDRI